MLSADLFLLSLPALEGPLEGFWGPTLYSLCRGREKGGKGHKRWEEG